MLYISVVVRLACSEYLPVVNAALWETAQYWSCLGPAKQTCKPRGIRLNSSLYSILPTSLNTRCLNFNQSSYSPKFKIISEKTISKRYKISLVRDHQKKRVSAKRTLDFISLKSTQMYR